MKYMNPNKLMQCDISWKVSESIFHRFIAQYCQTQLWWVEEAPIQISKIKPNNEPANKPIPLRPIRSKHLNWDLETMAEGWSGEKWFTNTSKSLCMWQPQRAELKKPTSTPGCMKTSCRRSSSIPITVTKHNSRNTEGEVTDEHFKDFYTYGYDRGNSQSMLLYKGQFDSLMQCFIPTITKCVRKSHWHNKIQAKHSQNRYKTQTVKTFLHGRIFLWASPQSHYNLNTHLLLIRSLVCSSNLHRNYSKNESLW